jgi:methionyl-tRNA formyltransferase
VSQRILFLAAATARSKAYAQALAERGLEVEACIIFDKPGAKQLGQGGAPSRPHERLGDIVLPDLSLDLGDSCRSLGGAVSEIEAESINSPLVVEAVRRAEADLVIFSGFGGQLVGQELLAIGAPLLHNHAGWLPDYRGSTTSYYSLLAEGSLGVSAILLSAGIDTGTIVARRRYPAPPPEVDIDYHYDSAIRAHLLTEVVSSWRAAGRFVESIEQDEAAGATYYVVHPVLKHLARLKLGEGAKEFVKK